MREGKTFGEAMKEQPLVSQLFIGLMPIYLPLAILLIVLVGPGDDGGFPE
jgi:hypothetical protein